MKIKLTYSNGDSQIVSAAEVAFVLLGRESINEELDAPITLVKTELLEGEANPYADGYRQGSIDAIEYLAELFEGVEDTDIYAEFIGKDAK